MHREGLKGLSDCEEVDAAAIGLCIYDYTYIIFTLSRTSKLFCQFGALFPVLFIIENN